MKSWVVFSIGVSRHFYIFSKSVESSQRVDFVSVEQVDTIIAELRVDHVTFVTRYDSEEEFRRQRQPDTIVERLRERYPQQGAFAE